uniref:INTS8 TPR repeats domain-containing protein n=1 Tax=Dendroctonus ponderosae TaxID=77166 RepID=A0AAR5NXE3_DENPD
MEVDLLNAGSVPISPDTVLSFEFLLDKELLLKHLQKPNPDPTPLDLITKFHDVITTTLRNRMEPETIESTTVNGSNEVKINHPAKNIAMKILSLKVAAFLNWNLAQIRALPFKTQIDLLQDLMYFTNEERTVFEITNLEQVDLKATSPEFLFALVLFHRWALNTSMHRVTSNWQQRYGINEMSLRDENIICCPENIQKTISFLHESLQWEQMPKLLSFDCFQMPTETNDSIEFNWSKATLISRDEFCTQICYDLGTSFFYQEDYKAAKELFHKCQEYLNLVTQQNVFASFDKNSLQVYIKACDPSVDVHKKSLLEQLNNSIVNQFVGITHVLQQDNLQKEIPLTHRINLELDIQGALSSGVFTVARDLLYKVKALNYVRCILEKKFLNEFSLAVAKNIDAFIWGIQVNWKLQSNEDKKIIKDYLFHLIIKHASTVPDLMERIKSNATLGNIFEMSELQYVIKTEESSNIPENLFASDTGLFETSKKRKPKMELRLLVRQLISSYNWKEIKDILLKIGMMNMGTSVWEMNPHWEVPIPIHSVLKSLPRGFLGELSYVLLAKSKEQLLTKNWNLALELLIVLDKELKNANFNVAKFCKMVNWEILLIQILQLLEEWPKSTVDKAALANACEVCLQSNESVIPRTEIVETCAICLLNLGRWEFLIAYEKRWTSFEIMSAVALACHEMVKNKCNKKFSKDLWDIGKSIFRLVGISSSIEVLYSLKAAHLSVN